MLQNRVALSWILVLAAALTFGGAVWSSATGNQGRFWAAFVGGLVMALAGLSIRRRTTVRSTHSEGLGQRGVIENESDLAHPDRPRPYRHYAGGDDERPDLEDSDRP